MSDQKSQQGSVAVERENEKEGDYVMLTREVLRVFSDRRIVELTAYEKSMGLVLLDKTIGYHCELRELPFAVFVEATGVPVRTVFQSLKTLVQKGLFLKQKIKGKRSFFYGLNPDFFQRIYPGKIENVYYLDKFKVHEVAGSRCNDLPVKHAKESTFKIPKPATGANSAAPKDTSNIYKIISQRDLSEFIKTRSTNTKSRWTSIVGSILERHPMDQEALWLAIDIVHRTNKDFLDQPIRSSILRLFEVTEWETMKSAMLYKLRKQKDADDAKKKQEETQSLIKETQSKLQSENPAEIDISKLDPRWQKFAVSHIGKKA